jgi:hypothetical protein
MLIPGAPPVEVRFRNAKDSYEAVIHEKGSWFDNWRTPTVYRDDATQERLMIARLLLMGVDDDLRQMPGPNGLLLHQAGVLWQGALIDLLNGDFDRAAGENAKMRELIPRVPPHLWGRDQRSIYESNAAFLDGEIALGRGEKESAITAFKQSLAIDLSIGDVDGVARSRRYLSDLGEDFDSVVQPPARGSQPSTSPQGFVLGKVVFLFVAFGMLTGLGRAEQIDVWRPAGFKGMAVVIISIIAGIVADRMVRRLFTR